MLDARGLPYGMDGTSRIFDFKDIIPWIVENGWCRLRHSSEKIAKAKPPSERAKGKKGKDDEDEMLNDPTLFGDELERYRAAKANLAELDYAKKKGDLIEKEKHEEFVQMAGDYCRQAFQSLPKKLCVKMAKMRDAGEVEKLLENEIVAVLRELSEREVE